MLRLEMRGVVKSFSSDTGSKPVLKGVSISVEDGKLLSLLGRSGCGKTTLLRIAAGFERADSGAVLFDGVPVTQPSYERFMVFQAFDQLFPWKRIEDNIYGAIRTVKPSVPKAEARDITRFWLEETCLTHCARQWPCQLSGGMKQRAALARAFALNPRMLLLDEPFSGLDAVLRGSMQQLLLSLCEKHSISALFVTHDIDEALFLCDCPAVMRADGSEIVLSDKPDDMRGSIVELLGMP